LARPADDLAVAQAWFGTPEAAVRAFIWALASGDLEAATACLTSDSSLVTPDATSVSGRGAIRGVLAQLIAQQPEISIGPSSTLAAGDVAFVNQRWRIRLRASPDSSYVQVVSPILVLHRVDDDWKLAIAAPWVRQEQ
jgi:ketosteroid isomerase-like protein